MATLKSIKERRRTCPECEKIYWLMLPYSERPYCFTCRHTLSPIKIKELEEAFEKKEKTNG